MIAIFKRELKSYFNGITGYIFCIFMLLFAGIFTMSNNLSGAYPNFEYVLASLTIFFIIGIPVLTMRAIAEERHQKIDQLLYSLPISMTKIIMGKFLAMVVVLSVPILIMCLYPLILNMFGNVSLAVAYGSLLGFWALGAALLSMGLFISSLTENQAVAAVLCFLVMLVNYLISSLSGYVASSAIASLIALIIIVFVFVLLIRMLTKNTLIPLVVGLALSGVLVAIYFVVPKYLVGLFPTIMNGLSLFERFNSFISGIFDITSLVYFVTVVGIFIFLTVQSQEKRRWS